jgi:hypothetical protein
VIKKFISGRRLDQSVEHQDPAEKVRVKNVYFLIGRFFRKKAPLGSKKNAVCPCVVFPDFNSFLFWGSAFFHQLSSLPDGLVGVGHGQNYIDRIPGLSIQPPL